MCPQLSYKPPGSIEELQGEVSLGPALLQAGQAQLSQPFLREEMFHLLVILVPLFCTFGSKFSFNS